MAKTKHTPKKVSALKPGLSLRQLSKQTGVPMPHLSRIVSGQRGLTVRVARLIAQATGQSLDRVVTVLL